MMREYCSKNLWPGVRLEMHNVLYYIFVFVYSFENSK